MNAYSVNSPASVRRTEKVMSAAPTKRDYKETAALFRDFQIPNIACPEFPSRTALIRWRTDTINRYLA